MGWMEKWGAFFFENPIVYVCMLEEDHNGE